MHTYSQSTGRWLTDGRLIGVGYSGTDDGDGVREPGEGRNDPAMEAAKNVGPIPRGRYRIGSPFLHPSAGPLTMRLTPEPGTDTHGRGGFLIHGDSRIRPGTASHGCIVLAHDPRTTVAFSVIGGDNVVEVVS